MKINISKVILVTGVFIFLGGFPHLQSQNNGQSYGVEYYGALKNFMQQGDLTAKVSLSKIALTKNVYALGALENLKGEIQIFDSQPLISRVVDSLLQFDYSFDQKASLLVVASVEKWRPFAVPKEISDYKKLEAYIVQLASDHQINTGKPFPFLLEGIAKSVDWHVINWKEGDRIHTHEKHKQAGLYGTLYNTAVEMLGFYSDAHHGIFTHHSTNMHIHVKTSDKKIAGHVDDMTLLQGMILKLPDH